MAAQIPFLIDKQDNFEIVRDKIATILLEEQANQQVLAAAAVDKDPRLFKLRVFTERTNPWSEWQDAPPNQLDASPVVNITFETTSGDKSGNVVARQMFDATYNIDCYGYGVSVATTDGHVAGDAQAAIVSHRAAKLVRNILMSAFYVKLDLPAATVGVGLRWVSSITSFTPELDARPVQNVIGTRIAFQVKMNEFAPQVEGQPLEQINVTVFRRDGETGEIFLEAQYGEPPP